MFSWIFTILALWASWFLTDIRSESTMENTIFPLMVIAFSISLLFKLVYLLGLNKTERSGGVTAGGSSVWTGVDGDGGGDGGC